MFWVGSQAEKGFEDCYSLRRHVIVCGRSDILEHSLRLLTYYDQVDLFLKMLLHHRLKWDGIFYSFWMKRNAHGALELSFMKSFSTFATVVLRYFTCFSVHEAYYISLLQRFVNIFLSRQLILSISVGGCTLARATMLIWRIFCIRLYWCVHSCNGRSVHGAYCSLYPMKTLHSWQILLTAKRLLNHAFLFKLMILTFMMKLQSDL